MISLLVSDNATWAAADPTRRAEIVAWLAANRINPDDVPLARPVVLEGTPGSNAVIRHTAYLRNDTGAYYAAADGVTTASEERTVPLLVDPPQHWALHTQPTAAEPEPASKEN